MSPRRTSLVLIAVVLACLVGLAAVTAATDESNVTKIGRVPVPIIPAAIGENCVEDTDFMRRNHMSLLKHQRDDTVHEGIRSKQHSLKECIDCHVVMGPDEIPVTVASPQHFCRSCHDYTAVSIDCFQCHASRPEPADMPAGHPLSGVSAEHASPDLSAAHGVE